MTEHTEKGTIKIKPNVKPGDWITIGNTDCVVCKVYDEDSPWDIEVVYCPSKPANSDANWIDGKWEIVGGAPGYAADYGRLSYYVSILKKGRYY